MKIAFVTNPRHPDLEDDDRPLAEALARRGALVVAASWDEEGFDWSKVDLALIRSPWDYYRRYAEFLAWLDATAARTRVVNPPDVLKWNANKRYLAEVAAIGVHTVPTVFVKCGEVRRIEDICVAQRWSTVVLKPAISADSWETIRVEPSRYSEGQAYLDRHRDHREIMVQPFVKDVEIGSEQCLVWFGGEYSHAVTKNSAFKGGRHVGPEGRLIEPGRGSIEFAHDLLSRAEALDLPYARVDIARDDDGRPMLLELELFEPTLFFLEKPGCEERLADILIAARPSGPHS